MKKVRFFQDVMGLNVSIDIGPSDVTLVLLKYQMVPPFGLWRDF